MSEIVSAILKVGISGSGVDGFGREKNTKPSFEGKQGASISPSLSYNWSQWLFFFQEYFPLGQASGARMGSWVELFIYPLRSKRLLVEQLSQDINNSFPFSFTLASGMVGSLLAQK